MNILFSKTFSAGLALLMLSSALSACASGVTEPPKNESPSTALSSPLETSPQEPSASPTVTPSDPSSSDLPELAITKENALQKLNEGFTATMGLTSLKLTGLSSSYSAGAGKGDTLNFPISYACDKSSGTFKASLTYGNTAGDMVCYFEGTNKYVKQTDSRTGAANVTTESAKAPFDTSTSLMPVLFEELSITSYQNVFARFCQTDFGIELKDGVFALYFYGSYADLARIVLEDDAYEAFLAQNPEGNYTTEGMMELFLTEDGYFKGMSTEFRLESPEKTTKNTLSFTFYDFNQPVTLEKPDFVTES